MEEYHYKMLCVSPNLGAAVQEARRTAFYRDAGFRGAESHIDDKFRMDIDDVFLVREVLAAGREQYAIATEWSAVPPVEDELHIGYLKLDRLTDSSL